MKILHVESGRHYYGGARQVVYLLEGLAAQGHTNLLACPVNADIAPHASPHAAVLPIPMQGDADAILTFRLASIIRRERPDLVHIHSRRGADLWGGLASRLCRVPCVVSRRVDNRELAIWARTKYGLYSHVITISEEIRRVILAEGLPPARVTCVRSAIDPAPYLHPVDKAAFTREFNLPQNSLTVGIVAQLIPRKGHRYLLDALPPLLKEFPTLRLLIFGRGPLERDLRARIATLNLQHAVHLTGFRDDLPTWLGGLDILVHPAEIEGLGVSLLQAAAAALPIITSRAGGMPEVVLDNHTGLLTAVGDIPAIQAALRRLLTDATLRHALGQAGRARVIAEFSVNAMVQGNQRVYEHVLG